MPSPNLKNQIENTFPVNFDSPIPVELRITDPNAVSTIFHEVKGPILRLLIDKFMTIRELSEMEIGGTKYNPGTIKRHLEDLLSFRLIQQLEPVKNTYGITLKYYRATAQKFIIQLVFPTDEKNTIPKKN